MSVTPFQQYTDKTQGSQSLQCLDHRGNQGIMLISSYQLPKLIALKLLTVFFVWCAAMMSC